MSTQKRVLDIHERFHAELLECANQIWRAEKTAACGRYMASIWRDPEHLFQTFLRLNKPVEKLGKNTPIYSTMISFPLRTNLHTLSPDELQEVRADIAELQAFLNQFLVTEVLERDDCISLFVALS